MDAKVQDNQCSEIGRFCTLADGIPFMVWVVGVDGEQYFVNKAYCEFFGVNREEVLGQKWQMLVHPDDRKAYTSEFLNCVRNRSLFHSEARVKRADGQWRWVESFGNTRFSEAGEFIGFVGTSPDITERKVAEQQIRESEERYRIVANNTYDWELWRSPDGNYKYCSPSCFRITGYTHHQFQSQPELFDKIIHPEDISVWRMHCIHLVDKKVCPEVEFRILRADGEIRWIGHACQLVFGTSGNFIGERASNRDITERKQADAALRESEERFKLFMDNSPTIAWMKDARGRHVYLSKTCQQRFGVRKNDWYGKTDAELWPPETAEVFRKNDLAVLASDLPMDVIEETLNADGTRCYWLNSKFSFSDTSGNRFVGGIGLDITERKQTESALRTARAALERERDLLQSIMDGTQKAHLVYMDRDFNFVRVNKAYAATCGYTPEEMIGKNHFALYPHAENEAIFARVRETGILAEFHDRPFSFPDQPERGLTYWDWTLTPDKDREGNVLGLIFALFETTARVNAEAALRESEERFRALVSASSEVMYRISPDWSEIREAHARGSIPRVIGSVQKMMGDFIPEEDHMKMTAAIHEAIRTKGTYELEHRMKRTDGSLGWILARAVPLLDKNGEIIEWFGTASDITARQQLAESLRESEERLRLAQDAARVGAFGYNLQTGVCTWTPQIEVLHGLVPGTFENTKEAWEKLVHPIDLPKALCQIESSIQTGLPTAEEWRVIWPDGSIHWIAGRWQVHKDEDGKPVRMTGINFDITHRKMVEEQLRLLNEELENKVRERTATLVAANKELVVRTEQLRRLSGELTKAEQRERKRMSKVLHDGLQQHLVAAKLRLGELSDEQCASEVEQLLNEAVAITRSLAAELSPPILHDSGLVAAIEWLARLMSKRYNLDVHLQVKMDAIPLSEDMKVLLFESVRELLLNVVKHAGTKEADIHLARTQDHLAIIVSDKGRGFEMEKLSIGSCTDGGLGLFSIRERVELLGGKFKVDCCPGKGAQFTLIAPLNT